MRDATAPIALHEVVDALAAFESSLVSFNSRYDRYAFGDANALSELELQGYNVFRGFVARCSQCHIPPLFTDGELAVVGAPAVPGEPYDRGAGRIDHDPALTGAFKTPTLRDLTRTAGQLQHRSGNAARDPSRSNDAVDTQRRATCRCRFIGTSRCRSRCSVRTTSGRSLHSSTR
jgi:hypothetical protein